jgi:hypothetical protein
MAIILTFTPSMKRHNRSRFVFITTIVIAVLEEIFHLTSIAPERVG